MQTILLAFSSSNEYVPYLAQWPILSLLPSPPSTSSVPLSWLIRDIVHFSHTCLMVLWRYLSWWRKYVLGWIPITPMSLSTLSVFPGIAPANRIDADRRMFPAGMPQTYGWLSHFHSFPHVFHFLNDRDHGAYDTLNDGSELTINWSKASSSSNGNRVTIASNYCSFGWTRLLFKALAELRKSNCNEKLGSSSLSSIPGFKNEISFVYFQTIIRKERKTGSLREWRAEENRVYILLCKMVF